MKKITPCLWFDKEAEEAAKFYVEVFDGRGIQSKIGDISYYPDAGQEITGGKPGSVLTVEFSLGENDFLALNGGPNFKFSEAVSFQVFCKDQEEIDYFWDKLREGGGVESQCGWLKDRFGLSWQVTPEGMGDLLGANGDKDKANRAMNAMLQMQKIDIKKLLEA